LLFLSNYSLNVLLLIAAIEGDPCLLEVLKVWVLF